MKIRLIAGAAVSAFFVLVLSLRGIAGFWTDYLWFDALGHENVFVSVFGAQVVLVALFTALFFGILFTNLRVRRKTCCGTTTLLWVVVGGWCALCCQPCSPWWPASG